MQQLIDYLNSIAQMSTDLEQHLRKILKRQVFKKKEFILKEGEVCRHIRFIESGIIRISETVNNKEVTPWIQREGAIFVSINSFFDQVPSTANIVCVERCVTWGNTHEELHDTLRDFPEFRYHEAVIKTEYHKIQNQRETLLRGMSARQRYEWLMDTDNELIGRVPLPYLASYLDLSKDKLSRVRQEIAREK